jgi:hypothetical protein
MLIHSIYQNVFTATLSILNDLTNPTRYTEENVEDLKAQEMNIGLLETVHNDILSISRLSS